MTVAAILRHKGAEAATAMPGQSIAEIAGLLARRRIGAVVVLEGAALAGIVSIGDVVKARMMDQEAEVDGLRAYASGAAA